MRIGDVLDAPAIRRRLFPPRVIQIKERIVDRVSTDRSRNSSGGDYDEWHRWVIISADPTEAMPGGMTFLGVGKATGRALYAYPGYQSSSDWFDMCPCCGRYETTRGTWGFCRSCDGEDWQDGEGMYSPRNPDGDYVQVRERRAT